MTDEPAPAASREAPSRGADIVDAEYETVSDHETAAKTSNGAIPGAIGTPAAPLAGMDMLRAGNRQATAGLSARGGPLFWTFGVGVALAAFWVSGGHALVRDVPFLTAQTERQALRISAVTSRVDVSGARAVLFVDGEAANDGDQAEVLPALDIVVTGNDGRITRYRLGTASRSIAPGDTFAFSSRLDVPKNGVKTVSVTFGE